ncbi:MAG: hypothetical protein R2685_12110 [Candidatus Nitrosocosmicus sp.]|nr:hypothetical protein [Candidatus Nitrosocosmicus sp.]
MSTWKEGIIRTLLDRFDSNKNLDAHINNNKFRTKPLKVFDWINAAKINKENNIQNASIGLSILLEDTIPILQKGKPIKITDTVLTSSNSDPVLIDNDSGQIMNCFFIIDEGDLEYHFLQTFRYIESTKLSEWPKAALDIIKGAFYYKDIQENKLSQVYLISPLIFSWKILDCGCFGI